MASELLAHIPMMKIMTNYCTALFVFRLTVYNQSTVFQSYLVIYSLISSGWLYYLFVIDLGLFVTVCIPFGVLLPSLFYSSVYFSSMRNTNVVLKVKITQKRNT